MAIDLVIGMIMYTGPLALRSLSISMGRDAHGCYQEQLPAGCEVKAKNGWLLLVSEWWRTGVEVSGQGVSSSTINKVAGAV